MHLAELYRSRRPVFSIELFPPKTPQGVTNLKDKLKEIQAHRPDFVSVTYGAGGGTRHTTLGICAHIRQALRMEAVAHITCAAHTKAEIHQLLSDLRAGGIGNVMALRGDPPPDGSYVVREEGYRNAIDLVRAIRADGTGSSAGGLGGGLGGDFGGAFGIGVAGYPQGHVEAPSYAVDLQRQVEKINAGADVVVAQFFLENGHFLRWRDDLHRAGIRVPIVPGILPALSVEQITRFSRLCGVTVPPALMAGLEQFQEHPESAAAYGLVFAMKQVEALLAEGVDGIHLYALNRLESIRSISALVRGAGRVTSPAPARPEAPAG